MDGSLGQVATRSSQQVPTVGTRLGRYVLLEEVGSGGMGVVMAAYDRELDRRVALKLLRPDLSRSGEIRMKREAQALAQLQHPSVVTVYEVGEHQGQLYIAMEYVDGETLERWAARHRGQWRKVVEVAVRAGRGVAAAHAVGLVHRDIKPSNVLVGRDGRARVVDFGIATAVAPAPSEERLMVVESGEGRPRSLPSDSSRPAITEEETVHVSGSMAAASSAVMVGSLDLTEAGVVVGTPAYMAPEQHRGQHVDARSDQFSLCVTLYRVLYDDVPFAGGELESLRAAVCAGVVKAPPAGTTVPPSVRRVLLRGMEVEPSRRWPTVTAMLDALERTAHRRRRWVGALGLVGVGAVAAAAVAGGLVSSSPSACPQAQQRLVGVWDEDRIAQARAAFEATALPYAQDAWTRTRERLDRQAEAWSVRYAEVCAAMNDARADASADLEMACLRERREELGALVELLIEGDATVVAKATQAAADLASVDGCRQRGVEAAVMAGVPPSQQAEVDEIRLTLARSVAAYKAGLFAVGIERAEAASQRAAVLGYGPVEVEALYRLGTLQGFAGQLDEAEHTLRDATLRAVEVRHDRVAVQSATMLAFVVGYRQGKPEEGIIWTRHAKSALGRLEWDPLLDAEIRVTRASIFQVQGHYELALTEFTNALEQRIEQMGEDHPTVGASYNNIGGTLRELGRNEEALAAMERARAVWGASYGPQHPVVATAHNGIGGVLEQMGRFVEARERFEQALQIREGAFGPDHISLAIILDNLGSVLTRLGEFDRAQRVVERALAMRERSLGSSHPHYPSSLVNLGLVAEKQGRLEDACAFHRRAIALWEESLGPTHPFLSHPLTSLGRAERALGRDEIARPLLERALGIREAGAKATELAETQLLLAQVLWPTEPGRARELAERAQTQMVGAPDTFAEQAAEIDTWLGEHPAAAP